MAANDEHVRALQALIEPLRLTGTRLGNMQKVFCIDRITMEERKAIEAAIRALSAQQPEPDWEAALDRATDRIVEAQQPEAAETHTEQCDFVAASTGDPTCTCTKTQPQGAVSEITPQWVIGYLPMPVDAVARLAIENAFREWAALRPDAGEKGNG